MQDAIFGSWARESQVPLELLGSVRELNRRFLDLICAGSAWESANPAMPEVSARIAPLSAVQRAAAANCPYALFDLRFGDDGHWRTMLSCPYDWQVHEIERVDADTLEFVRLALFFAWHAASAARLAAPLLLGMHWETAAAFRAATIDCLPALALTEAAHLTARWKGCTRYWYALAGAASRPGYPELRRIQLYGVQLAAAARLA